MNQLLEKNCSKRRQPFTLLLNIDEYQRLSRLSDTLGISKGSTLRMAVRNLLNTQQAGKHTLPVEIDDFWKTFKGN